MVDSTAHDGTARGIGTARERKRSEKLKQELPEGIRIGEWSDDRKKRFFVRFGSDRRVESFEHEADRNDRAEKLRDAKEQEGSGILDFDVGTLKEWLQFQKETGCTLQEIKKLWQRFQHTIRGSLKTSDAVQQYLAIRRRAGVEEKSDTYRHYKKHLVDCLCGVFGDMPLASITSKQLLDLLETLKDRDGKGPATGVTKRNYRKDWFSFFDRAVLEKWVAENPCLAVDVPKVVDKSRPFLSLREAFEFFKAALTSPIGARLAIEAFAGLRVSSSARMEEHEVCRIEGGIELPAGKHKVEKRFFIQGFPDNLFAWLDLPDQWWDISESYYDKLKGDVFTVSRVKNPGNVLRHSFATYHVAAYGDASKTATLLTHRSPSMLCRHYLGRGVSRNIALQYFAITPATVQGTFEQFLASTSQTHEHDSHRSHRQRNRSARSRNRPATQSQGHPHPDGAQATSEAKDHQAIAG